MLGQSLQQVTVISNLKQCLRRITGLRKIDLGLCRSHSYFNFLIKQASPETYFFDDTNCWIKACPGSGVAPGHPFPLGTTKRSRRYSKPHLIQVYRHSKQLLQC